MSRDRVVIPLGSRFLVLDRETFETALTEGRQFDGTVPASAAVPSVTRLLTAKQMQEATGKPASWFERQARERRIPAIRLGNSWHFSLEEVREWGGKPALDSILAGNGSAGPQVQKRSVSP